MNLYGYEIQRDSDLMHHGIKGQHWGVRRYQNEDGTLTSAGARRYGTNLDINDKSRANIANIRLGEARRRLDTAKRNNETNATRIAELQGRVRSAKKAKSMAKSYDRGAKRVARGETIIGNKVKSRIAIAGAIAAKRFYNSPAGLNLRLKAINNTRVYAPGMAKTVDIIDKYAPVAITALSLGYTAKKTVDNSNIRNYYSQTARGTNSIKSVGSQEYADVVKRRKENS